MQNQFGVTAVVPNCSQGLVSSHRQNDKENNAGLVVGEKQCPASTNTKMRKLKALSTR